MDPTMTLGPTFEQANALMVLWDAIVDWFRGDGDAAAEVASSYRTDPVTRAPDSGISIASLPAVARQTETGYSTWYFIPELIELRVGPSYEDSLEAAPSEAAEVSSVHYRSGAALPRQACRQLGIPREAIEYRYGAEAKESLHLPVCGSQ